jgi:2-C-methyl-D-erythritol 4-phosphate cytidylyltransferase
VHDAARPLASGALFHAVVDAVVAGADAAIPGLAISDTVKRVTRDDDATRVVATLAREELVTVQTPQAFRRSVLERAHESSEDASDDAALVEALGARVVVVNGELSNIKITHVSDIELLSFVEGGRQ